MGVKFTITKGVDNIYTFTIKENGVTTPMPIDVSDTFIAQLIDLATNTVVIEKSLVIVDASTGKLSLSLSPEEVSILVSERGSKVDRYYLKPVYKLLLDCNTIVNGDFIAKVAEVRVDG